MLTKAIIERVPQRHLGLLHDALSIIEASDPPTVRDALEYFRSLHPSNRTAYGPRGCPITPKVIRWAAKWIRAGVTSGQVVERLRRGYNPGLHRRFPGTVRSGPWGGAIQCRLCGEVFRIAKKPGRGDALRRASKLRSLLYRHLQSAHWRSIEENSGHRRNPIYFMAAWPSKWAGFETTGILQSLEAAVAAIPADSRTGAFVFQTEAPSVKLALRKSLWGQWWKRPLDWVLRKNPSLKTCRNSRNPLSRRHRRHRPFRPLPPPRRIDRPRHFHWNPDAEVMRHQLAGYQARGQRVLLGHPDMDVKARVEGQLTGGPGALFKIRLEDPMGQDDYEAALGLYPGQASKVFGQAEREGRLNGEGRIKALTVPWAFLSLDVESSPRGTLVEYQTEDVRHVSSMRVTPGRIVGLERGIGSGGEGQVLMELFEPLPIWQIPASSDPDRAKPGFRSKTAYFLDDHCADVINSGHYPEVAAWVGPMKAIEGAKAHALDDPKPISEMKARLRPIFGGLVEICELSWPLWFIVPLWWGGATQSAYRAAFRPMREDLAKGLELEVYEGAEWLEGLR